MTKEELSALGITAEDVLERLTEKMFQHYVETEESYKGDFETAMEKAIKQQVNDVIAATVDKHVLPLVSDKIEHICLQETNRWGEATKAPAITFIEYLVQRADAYIREEVDHKGKTRSEDSYNWSAKTTRIAHMVHEHLHYNISKAMVEALGKVNSSIRKGLEEAVNLAIKSIQITVDTKAIDKS